MRDKQIWSLVSNAALDTSYTVPRLLEENQYRFRVSAQNRMGVGVGIESDVITAKSCIGMLKLRLRCLPSIFNVYTLQVYRRSWLNQK